MKKLFIILAAGMMVFLPACKGTTEKDAQQEAQTVKVEDETGRYQLYPTFNRWTFLKLDTKEGKITQVQYSLDEENEFETFLGAVTLDGKEEIGRYELYPTQNNWTFIMLDKVKGISYHVQWNQEPSQRFITRILKTF